MQNGIQDEMCYHQIIGFCFGRDVSVFVLEYFGQNESRKISEDEKVTYSAELLKYFPRIE